MNITLYFLLRSKLYIKSFLELSIELKVSISSQSTIFNHRHENEIKNMKISYESVLEKLHTEMNGLKQEKDHLQQQRQGVVSAVSSIFGLEHQVNPFEVAVTIYVPNLLIKPKTTPYHTILLWCSLIKLINIIR